MENGEERWVYVPIWMRCEEASQSFIGFCENGLFGVRVDCGFMVVLCVA